MLIFDKPYLYNFIWLEYFIYGGIFLAVCYNNLWKLLIDKNMNRTELKEAAGISFNVLARMGKNEAVSFESIEKILKEIQETYKNTYITRGSLIGNLNVRRKLNLLLR